MVKLLIWMCLLCMCIQQEVASIYIVLTGFVLIDLNLGNEKKQGSRVSAYSVYNENWEAIDGSLKAEHFERDILYKKKANRLFECSGLDLTIASALITKIDTPVELLNISSLKMLTN